MADLTTTISENVTLNGSVRGSTNTLTTTGIVDVFERIVTCAHSNVTTLDANEVIDIAVVTTNTNYQVVLTSGTSHILCQADTTAIGEEDTTPAFTTLENITSIQIKPRGSADVQVEMFVGLV